jgi:hypothetical protein
MSKAHLEDLDTLRVFRVALLKFAELANGALDDAESEMQRTLSWLENEQHSFWQTQIRRRHDIVEKCKEAVRMKKLFKDATGRQQSAVDEEKALSVARRRLDEAHAKLVATRKYVRVLERQIQLYKGTAQRLATTVQVDVPQAASKLDRMLRTLEQYAALQAPGVVTSQAPSDVAPMTRAVDESSPPAQPPASASDQPPEKQE